MWRVGSLKSENGELGLWYSQIFEVDCSTIHLKIQNNEKFEICFGTDTEVVCLVIFLKTEINEKIKTSCWTTGSADIT